MPRLNFVKRSRKDRPNIGVKAGESYYWWQFKTGPTSSLRRESKEKPKRSQLTLSDYLGRLYDIQDDTDFHGAADLDDLSSLRDETVTNLTEMRDECEEKRSNMPESLQDSDSGTILQDRYDSLDSAIGTMESVDIPDNSKAREEIKDELKESGDITDETSADDIESKIDDKITERVSELADELRDALDGVE